jgi:hypothetical protein
MEDGNEFYGICESCYNNVVCVEDSDATNLWLCTNPCCENIQFVGRTEQPDWVENIEIIGY